MLYNLYKIFLILVYLFILDVSFKVCGVFEWFLYVGDVYKFDVIVIDVDD